MMTTNNERGNHGDSGHPESPLDGSDENSGVRINAIPRGWSHVEDLRRYELEHEYWVTDQMISYATSVVEYIEQGKPHDHMFSLLSVELPVLGYDMARLVSYLNYMLETKNMPFRFDQTLNLTVDDDIVSRSKFTIEMVREHQHYVQTGDPSEYETLVKGYGERLANGMSLSIVLPFLKHDLVISQLNNRRFAEELNAFLVEKGSPLRFNEYLEPLEVHESPL